MRISDWSSDVCSSDLPGDDFRDRIISDILVAVTGAGRAYWRQRTEFMADFYGIYPRFKSTVISVSGETKAMGQYIRDFGLLLGMTGKAKAGAVRCDRTIKIQHSVCSQRSEEHTSELQSLMR